MIRNLCRKECLLKDKNYLKSWKKMRVFNQMIALEKDLYLKRRLKLLNSFQAQSWTKLSKTSISTASLSSNLNAPRTRYPISSALMKKTFSDTQRILKTRFMPNNPGLKTKLKHPVTMMTSILSRRLKIMRKTMTCSRRLIYLEYRLVRSKEGSLTEANPPNKEMKKDST